MLNDIKGKGASPITIPTQPTASLPAKVSGSAGTAGPPVSRELGQLGQLGGRAQPVPSNHAITMPADLPSGNTNCEKGLAWAATELQQAIVSGGAWGVALRVVGTAGASIAESIYPGNAVARETATSIGGLFGGPLMGFVHRHLEAAFIQLRRRAGHGLELQPTYGNPTAPQMRENTFTAAFAVAGAARPITKAEALLTRDQHGVGFSGLGIDTGISALAGMTATFISTVRNPAHAPELKYAPVTVPNEDVKGQGAKLLDKETRNRIHRGLYVSLAKVPVDIAKIAIAVLTTYYLSSQERNATGGFNATPYNGTTTFDGMTTASGTGTSEGAEGHAVTTAFMILQTALAMAQAANSLHAWFTMGKTIADQDAATSAREAAAPPAAAATVESLETETQTTTVEPTETQKYSASLPMV